jgi:ribonuclease P protein subunit RPR2
MRSRRGRPEWVTDTAKERISILLERAFSGDKRKKRYIEQARKIALRYNVRFPTKYKRRICKKCFGTEFRIRVFSKGKYVLYTCLECGEKYRYPYKPSKIYKEKQKE